MLTIDEFNIAYPVNSEVKYFNEKGEVITAAVRFPAEKNENNQPIFWASGNPSSIPLKNLIHEPAA
jgi:hypothetical protein